MDPTLLEPIFAAKPGGDDIRRDVVYSEISARVRRARGEALPDPDDPCYDPKADWKYVINACHDVLRHRSKDLMIAAWFTEARFAVDGFPGLLDALDLLRNLTDNFWETLYPEIEDGDTEARLRVFEWLDTRLAAAVQSKTSADTKPVPARTQSARESPPETQPDTKDAIRLQAQKLKLCVQSVEELRVACQGKVGDAAPTFENLRYALRQSLVDSAVGVVKQALHPYPSGANDNLEKLFEQILELKPEGDGRSLGSGSLSAEAGFTQFFNAPARLDPPPRSAAQPEPSESSPADPGGVTRLIQRLAQDQPAPAAPPSQAKPPLGSPPDKFTGIMSAPATRPAVGAPPVPASAPAAPPPPAPVFAAPPLPPMPRVAPPAFASPALADPPPAGAIPSFIEKQKAASSPLRSVGPRRVDFTLTAPALVTAGVPFELMVWAHWPEERNRILARAREELRVRDVLARTKGSFSIPAETALTVRLRILGAVIDEPEDTMTWHGESTCVSFVVMLPESNPHIRCSGSAYIYAGGAQIAKIQFLLSSAGAKETMVLASALRYRTAFASYASDDRDAVLARIQGIHKVVPELSVFLDVLSLRSGQNWEQELWRVIPTNDIFYLFWSDRARRSTWVDREWRCALRERGIEFIDPIPLQPAQEAPPPTELRSLHFHDWTLALRHETTRRANVWTRFLFWRK